MCIFDHTYFDILLLIYNSFQQNVSEYDKEIPQSQTEDKPHGIVQKSHTTIMRHQEDKQSKATISLFPMEMIAKLERTQSNAQRNIELQNPTMGATINNNRTIALERTADKATGGLKCSLLVTNIRPRFSCCWSTKMLLYFSSAISSRC